MSWQNARAYVGRWASCGLAGSLLLAASSSGLRADMKMERQRAARQLVAEALHREIYGQNAERERLLSAALQQSPDFAPALWHQGLVQHDREWLSPSATAARFQANPQWREYERKRQAAADTPAAQLALANWCREESLADQERAHLWRVLELDPEQATARARLNFRRLGDRWVAREELDASRAAQQQLETSLARWRPRLTELRQQLAQRASAKRAAASQEIREIRDASAIPALEQVLATASREAGELVVTTLADMPEPAAAAALARQAIVSAWPEVRTAAAQALAGREPDSYVPLLLAEMYSPVTTAWEVVAGRKLLVRQTFDREAQDHRQQVILDTEYERIATPGGDSRETFNRAVTEAQQQFQQRAAAVIRQNGVTFLINARIAEVLNVATHQSLPADPATWWQWWNDHNEVFVAEAKPYHRDYEYREIEIQDRTVSLAGSGGALSGGGRQGGYDCLAAGTVVWTATGPQAIEDLQVGDMVLSQDVETGEVALKPVLRTTIRPRGPLTTVQVGDERFATSGGHLFWVSGEGWIKSRRLASGMQLHGHEGTLPVTEVGSGDDELTYNLVVADFHTYFIGQSKILCHDNTVRRPTAAVVPGLATP